MEQVEKAEKEVGKMIEPIIDQINEGTDIIGAKNLGEVPKSKL